MNSVDKFLVDLAVNSPLNTGPVKVSAALIYKGRILATGTNQYKTHPLMLTRGYREDQNWRHAEVDCIQNAARFMTKEQMARCELRVVRAKRPGHNSQDWILGLAKPCPGCSQVIQNYGITNVTWTEDADVLDECGVDLY
jgi:deoxycytidylate deaminase